MRQNPKGAYPKPNSIGTPTITAKKRTTTLTKVRIAPRTSTSPIAVPRTIRNHDITVLTSLPAGKMVPVAAIPLLREDAARARVSLSFQMMETADLLINEINVDVKAYLVPNLAFERFTGMDDLNRSYEGKPPRDNLPVIPFIDKMSAMLPGNDQIMRYLGKHAKAQTMISTAYHEAYNAIWNFRAANRSPDIPKRSRLINTLAPAFWKHSRFNHIVPDFDQAVMDGNVALEYANNRIAVRGLATQPGAQPAGLNITTNEDGLLTQTQPAGPNASYNLVARKTVAGAEAQVFAELQDGGLTISLANIDLARKTQAFAKLRERYTGHDDDYIIDMLMDGLTVPEQAWRQPMLLQERSTIFGMSKRYATDGANLTDSVVNGATMLDLNFAVPRCPTGGVIMIVAEVTPGQLFERGRDPFLHAQTVEDFPHALRDMLDPEPVEVVRNDYIDIDHAAPAGTFGYAPLNHAWNFSAPCIGGRFYRPQVDAAFDEDRLRIWAVETKNPVLSADFYLCTTMHTKPFVNPNQDPFEVTAVGAAAINGLTQFGPMLVEANGNYDAIMEDAPVQRIEKV